MKKVFHLLLCGLGLLACTKEPEPQPEVKTYDFKGRRYEAYTYHSFLPNERAYFALDFVGESNLLRYNGYDSLGQDSTWYRYKTLGSPKSFAYDIWENGGSPWLWTYLSEDPFDIDDFYNSFTRHGYEIDITETIIYYFDDVNHKVYERVQ